MGRILAVDDELDMLALLKMIIEGYSDHQVTATNNPLEAAEFLEKETFDLILTDLKMPGMDGLELLALAKQRDADALVHGHHRLRLPGVGGGGHGQGGLRLHHQALPQGADPPGHRQGHALAGTGAPEQGDEAAPGRRLK